MNLGYVSLGAAPNSVGEVEEGMQAKAFKALGSEIYLNESGALGRGLISSQGLEQFHDPTKCSKRLL